MIAPYSFALKLERAKEHLKLFQTHCQEWVDRVPYEAVDEPDPDPIPRRAGGGYVSDGTWRIYRLDGKVGPTDLFDQATGEPEPRRVRVIRADPVPDAMSLILGDCLSNARATLDHLALSLANTHTPAMTPQQVRGSEFPIIESGKITPDMESRKLGCISPAARAVIKAFQPYHRGGNFRSHPLWQLHELNRIDKHRTLTVCMAYINGIAIKVGPGAINVPILRGYIATANVEAEVEAVPCRYSRIPHPSGREVNMEHNFPVVISFGRGTPMPLQPVIPAVQAILDFVRDSVIAPLSKFL